MMWLPIIKEHLSHDDDYDIRCCHVEFVDSIIWVGGLPKMHSLFDSIIYGGQLPFKLAFHHWLDWNGMQFSPIDL